MINKIETKTMELCDISEAIDLWQKQAQYFNTGKQICPFWADKNEAIEIYRQQPAACISGGLQRKS
jgi:hypothetical protein